MSIPKLRFRADDGSGFPEWEEKRLDEVVDFLDAQRKPLEAGERVAGPYPYYGASGIIDYVKDYIFDDELILLSEDGANIIDRNYRVAFLAKGKFWVNNHAHVLKAINGNVNYFICEELETFDYKKYNSGGAQPKLNQATCRLIMMHMPVISEQQKITAFLSTIDEIITTTQSELTVWEERKKGVMQKIFNREVRFKADDGSEFPEWEEKRLGELYQKNTERNGNQFTKERTISISTMKYNSEGNGADEKSLPSYKVLRVGDIAFEGHENREFAYGRFVLNDLGDGIMSPRFSCLRPIQPMINGFWKYYIHYEPIMRQILVRATKKGTMMHELVYDDFYKQTIKVPSLPEQQKIADCLSSLDDVINQIQAELSAWKEFKKGLLQQMFV